MAKQDGIRWVVSCSPGRDATQVPEQMALLEDLEQIRCSEEDMASRECADQRAKEEVRSLLNADPRVLPEIGGKRQFI